MATAILSGLGFHIRGDDANKSFNLVYEPETVFQAALPCGLAAASAGAFGMAVSLSAATTAAAVMGVALTVISAYVLLGIVLKGCDSARVSDFYRNLPKEVVATAAVGFARFMIDCGPAIIVAFARK